jgi:hypothetical protein
MALLMFLTLNTIRLHTMPIIHPNPAFNTLANTKVTLDGSSKASYKDKVTACVKAYSGPDKNLPQAIQCLHEGNEIALSQVATYIVDLNNRVNALEARA